jgi:hypothetical protein
MRTRKIGNNPHRGYAADMPETENPSSQNPRRYKWPWFVLAFAILGIVLAVLWVSLAAKKIEQERDFNEPLPSTAPER